VIVAVSGVPATGWTVTKVAMALRGQSVAGVGLGVVLGVVVVGEIRVGVRERMGWVEMRRCGSSMSILRLLRRLLGIHMCRVYWLRGVGSRISI